MKRTLTISVLLLLFVGGLWADDELPLCEGNFKTWTACSYTWADGEKYVGEYKDGKQHGQGIQTWASGTEYVGEYKDGKHHGQGIKTWASGNEYVGEWRNGNQNGQGTFTWSDGEKYVGEWKGGKPYKEK